MEGEGEMGGKSSPPTSVAAGEREKEVEIASLFPGSV